MTEDEYNKLKQEYLEDYEKAKAALIKAKPLGWESILEYGETMLKDAMEQDYK